MLDTNKFIQYGYPRPNGQEDIKCIIIHNTSNFDLSARDIFDYLNGECETSQGCTFLVDHNEIIQVMPLDYAVYNTGKGNDYACKFGIAIEICSNLDNEKYLIGQSKAIELILNLMREYNLTSDDIYFHNDWNSQAYCPATILNLYGNKKNFLKEFIND